MLELLRLAHALVFHRVPGVLVESLGEFWACYSPASGQTHLLNDESAAVLEILGMHDAMSPSMVCQALGADSGVAVGEIEQTMTAAWRLLVDTGLIRQSLTGITPAT